MPFSIACPHCGNVATVHESQAGQMVGCPRCGQGMPVMMPPGPMPGGPAPGMPPYGAYPPQASSGVSWVVVLAVVIVILLGVAGVLAALMLPAIDLARGAAKRTACMNNLRQIALALLIYEQMHRRLPPPYVTDDQGRPLYSWRVLMLPYLEDDALYRRFDLSLPWNDTRNLPVSQTGLSVFSCPAADHPPHETHYVVVVGPETAFPPGGVAMHDVRDGLSNTIAVIEIDRAIPWASPQDPTLDEVLAWYSQGPEGTLPHGQKINVAFLDSSCSSVDVREMSPQNLRAMLTRNGGETVHRP